jgi:hypothetical protein
MAAITEGLFKTHTTAAPTINFIINFWVFDKNSSLNWRYWLQCLISTLPTILSLYIAVCFDVRMRLILLTEWHTCVFRFDNPWFGWDFFDLFEEVASGSQQHNYYLIINLIKTLYQKTFH